jgi:hypothetical protein
MTGAGTERTSDVLGADSMLDSGVLTRGIVEVSGVLERDVLKGMTGRNFFGFSTSMLGVANGVAPPAKAFSFADSPLVRTNAADLRW